MEKKLKVLNYYKLLFLLMSYENSFSSGRSSKNLPKTLTNALVRKPAVNKLIKANDFSQIDSVALKSLYNDLEILSFNPSRFNNIQSICKKTVGEWKSLISAEDIKLLKKLGVKKSFSSSTEDSKEVGLNNVLISKRFCHSMIENFMDDIEKELKSREKKIRKVGVDKEHSIDDSLLIPFRKKLSNCETFNDIEDLLLTYTTSTGCDLMNGFLRGDLTTLKSKELELDSSWGTDLNVSFDLLLDVVLKSLKLKKEVIRGTLDEDITVYKGLTLKRFMKNTGIPKDVMGDFGAEENVARYIQNYSRGHLYYKTSEITSTSLDRNVAIDQAKRNEYEGSVVMEINVKKGTAFGKDFRKTSFGSDDYNKEVILMPNQKIEILGAYSNNMLHVSCQTVL